MAQVLIVEDDGALRRDLAEKVASWGHEIRVAVDGFDARKVMEGWCPHAILSDVHMPNTGGIEFLNELITSKSLLIDTVFIFISSDAGHNAIVNGLNIGADDYIEKPISYDILKAKLASCLRKQEALSAVSMTQATRCGAFFAASFIGSSAFLGLAAIIVLYILKSALGINIFDDFHLTDLLGT